MFPWASKNLEQGGHSKNLYWTQGTCAFLSAFFFLSGLFLVFSPFPILYSFLSLPKGGRKWAWLVIFCNSALVWFFGSPLALGLYLAWVGVPSLTLSEVLLRKGSLEKAAGSALGSMVLSAFLGAWIFSQIQHVELLTWVSGQVHELSQQVTQTLLTKGSMGESPDLVEWQQNLVTEFPSAIAICSLMMIWVNFVLLLKVLPQRMQELTGRDLASYKMWKTPEWLVWPAILMGFLILMDFGLVSDVAMNVFKFIMAIYVIQGLSILGCVFDSWGIQGFWRFSGFTLALLFMLPLILSLGFFDLWFNFRSRVK